ncbi:MAG: helix-hairpin-helix domain-containing protein [Chloroflexi bacterium]|nr:helix-hairpin-helix domain-containing protein [Chloroflexota bacterium]
MIAALRGTVTHWDDTTSIAWIEVQGVTYEVRIPAFAAEWIDSVRDVPDTQIFTYYHVSERSPQPLIIGFPDLPARDFFRKFIEVPDVGPVKAVRALTFPVAEIAGWIEAEDVKAIQQLPGIGQRLSQTIVAQLAGKLALDAVAPASAGRAAGSGDRSGVREDAIEALVALQYTRREAERAVMEAMRANSGLDAVEDLIRAVLEQQSPA